MKSYKNFQENYYEKEWSKLKLLNNPTTTGWKTNVPAPIFFDFVNWLKKQKISGNALDVGCGGGRYSIVLAKEGFNVYGIDFSKSAINIAKNNALKNKLNNKTYFKIGNVLNLPYKDNFFDLINDDGCLHHISKKDWKLYLNNINRVLKKNGILRIKVFSKNCNFYDENKKNTNSHWILIPKKDYTYFFNTQELLNLFKNYFEIIELKEKYHPSTKNKKFFFIILKKNNILYV